MWELSNAVKINKPYHLISLIIPSQRKNWKRTSSKGYIHLIWIDCSFAARRLESSGGSSLHKANASSKLPDAVNCTICKYMLYKYILLKMHRIRENGCFVSATFSGKILKNTISVRVFLPMSNIDTIQSILNIICQINKTNLFLSWDLI